MSYEDNFLQHDPSNYDTELESLLATSSLSLDDCEALYQNGKMSKEDFEYAKDWFEFYK
jgi:hypothetical protein|nr:MAG TPA: hypothetical protein [Caudoviricetes sp.]